MHGKSARTGAAHARAARASEGHGRALLPCAVLLALVALFIAPVRAYADANYRTVLWSGDYASGKQYIVGADNKYDAAAYICGQTSAQVAAYDLTVRYKLSATENDFAALADSLEKDWPGWNEDTLAQSLAETFTRDVNGLSLWDVMTQAASVSAGGGVIFNQGALSLFQVKYWQDSVDCDIYAVDTTSDAVSRARDDLQEILNGGGDSGGTPIQDGYYVFEASPYYYPNRSSSYYLGNTSTLAYTLSIGDISSNINLLPHKFKLLIPEQYMTKLNEVRPYDTNKWYAYMMFYNGSIYTLYVMAGNLTAEIRTQDLSNVGFGTNEYIYTITKSGTEDVYYTNLSGSVLNSSNYVLSDGSVTIQKDANYNASKWTSSNPFWSSSYDSCYFELASASSSPDPDPPSGPGNWPDTPSNPTPEPPTVPDPPENPEPDPPSMPVSPTPPPLEPPTNVTIPTGTTAADYTPWLRAILEQLQTLTDELASHCVHLQEEMQTSVNELQDTLIYRFNSLESQIWDLFNGLEDYLHDLAEWLAEQLDFNVNVDPYDDSSVLYWLRQIYSRLGNLPKSPTTVIDPDPTEPFDFWAWLMNLIANTVGGIIGDLVGDVAGLLDLFKDKFPFSIPWDIAALLTLLDGTRATPAFDVKIAAVPGWWQETTFRIDLSPFDSVASACRTMVNILWVMVLVMKTDWMLAIMGDATSFGERFARKVARTS